MNRKLGLALPVLILLSTDFLFAQGQIQSRKQQLEILRRDKVARLWPERQSQIVDLVNKYTEQGLFDDPSKGSNGFQPVVLGGMRADNGFTYGIGYRRSDLFRDRLGFRATARATLAKSTLFDFAVDSPKLNRGRAFVDFYAKYENSPTMSYYGQGQDSLEENKTSYRLEDTFLSVSSGFRFTDWFNVAVAAGGYFVHTGEGTREPSIDTKFPDLRQNVDYFHLGWLPRWTIATIPALHAREATTTYVSGSTGTGPDRSTALIESTVLRNSISPTTTSPGLWPCASKE